MFFHLFYWAFSIPDSKGIFRTTNADRQFYCSVKMFANDKFVRRKKNFAKSQPVWMGIELGSAINSSLATS